MKAFHNDENIKQKYLKHEKGERSVLIAKEFFERNGFKVSQARKISANGPDLHIEKNDEIFRVEVKSVVKSVRCFKINKTLRVNDDYIAFVFNSGNVHVETMKEHLSKCSKDGSRAISALAKIYL